VKNAAGQGGVAWFRGSRWHRVAWLAAWIMIAGASWLQGALTPPKLTGIVQVENSTLGLFELEEQSGGQASKPTLRSYPILREGERSGPFELIALNRTNGSAIMNGPTGEERLQVYTNQPPTDRTINLHQAGLEPVLDLYQMLGNHTVLRPPQLTSFRIDLQSEAGLSSAQAAQTLEKVFGDNGLIVEHRGEFVFIIPSSKINALLGVPNPPESATTGKRSPAPGAFPPGLVKFQESDLTQVLDFFAELGDKILLTSSFLPPMKITVRSQTSMTRKETMWMMNALLRLGEVSTVSAGKDFMFVVPADRVKTLPTYDDKALAGKASDKGGSLQLRFANASLKDLLGFYAELTGRQALPIPPELPQVRLSFQGRKPLAQPDCIFALESLAALNNVRFQFVGEKQVGLIADR
jgi:hypothetical protein